MAAIIASVLPQVTTMFLFESKSRFMYFDCFLAKASLKFWAPQVIAYWLKSSWATSLKRFRISCGESKSGNPCDRLIASYSFAILVIRRITESVNVLVLFDNSFIITLPFSFFALYHFLWKCKIKLR